MNENRLIIGTRRSALALRKTEIAAKLLRELEPGLQIQMETFHTTGDRILEKPLQEFGGKGVFVTELEQAILEGRVDLAVHSAKDMPMELEPGLEIVGVPKREDPRDVLVTRKGDFLEGRLQGSFPIIRETVGLSGRVLQIGTSSPRRKLQMEQMGGLDQGQILCRTLRGNVQTRLEKLLEGGYDGIILAAAGLKRLGLLEDERFSFCFLDPKEFVPAGGQGILAIEGKPGTRAAALCHEISDEDSWLCLQAERSVLDMLGAGCHEPIGVYCEAGPEKICIRAVGQKNGRFRRVCLEGKRRQAEELARETARLLVRLE